MGDSPGAGDYLEENPGGKGVWSFGHALVEIAETGG